MSGDAVPGPLGAALTKAQKEGIREVLRGLEQRGAQLDPRKALRAILKNKPVAVKFEGQDWKIESLADLKLASELVGDEPIGSVGSALRKLAGQGWELRVHSDRWTTKSGTLLEAYRAVTHGSARFCRQLQVKPPVGHRLENEEKWVEPDMLPAIEAFYGSGNTEGLENPELASSLLSLQKEGITLKCWGEAGLGSMNEEAFSWYSSAQKGNSVRLQVHGTDVFETDSFTPADLEELRSLHREWEQLDRALFQPAVQAGKVPEHSLDDLVKAVALPVSDLTLEERARLCLDLASVDQNESFYNVRRLYQDLVEHQLEGPEFRKQCALASELAAVSGSESARQAMKFLLEELPQEVPLEQARSRFEQAFCKLFKAGMQTELARKCLELARLQVDGSPFEARIEEMTRLHDAGQRHPDYEGLREDYRAVLEHRRSGENLTQAARPLIALLDALSGQPELARKTYVDIRQGVEFGLLPGTEEQLLQRFLQSLLHSSPEEARAALSRPEIPTGRALVQETHQHIQMGGILLRKRVAPQAR